MGSYADCVTICPYNGYIAGTNPVVRHVMSLVYTLKQMRANQHVPKHATTQPLHDSNTRAKAPNLCSVLCADADCAVLTTDKPTNLLAQGMHSNNQIRFMSY